MKTLHQLRKHDEFIRRAKSCKSVEAEVEEGRYHTKVKVGQLMVPVPRHPGDLKKGTRLAIIKAFLVMGITVLTLLVLYYTG